MNNKRKINRLLVANRSEIAIRILRAASELEIRTVALYTYEDRYSLHRFKADEAYLIGKRDEPLKPYLDIEGIIKLAKRKNIDAIHPGYGFLSENVDFVRRCEEEGIIFVGPASGVMDLLGDKVDAKKIAREVSVPVIEDSEPLDSLKLAKKFAKDIGYPVLIKAAAGGGGRGMRIVKEESDLDTAFEEARNESKVAFGDDKIFVEKYIDNPKHLEVQIIGDNHGNIVHLYERDCSVQRRFQKVVEIGPSPSLKQSTKDKLYEYALKIANHVNYNGAGTVEFLIDQQEDVYFIEVNPRVQVEHTVTEEVTGVDIVRSQILIAEGLSLDHELLDIKDQSSITCNGYAIQCRITTENPLNNFMPDYGKIIAYRSPGGFGIRLDAGSAYSGAVITPFFDSLLVKVTGSGRTLAGAAQRLTRALQEFRVRGLKTNIPFVENVIANEEFQAGEARVNFINDNPSLFKFKQRRDRATKVLKYLAEVAVNGNPDIKAEHDKKNFIKPTIPDFEHYEPYPDGTKQKLTELGPDKFADWIKSQNEILITDTTLRDAHQSLLATRVRTTDILNIAESLAKRHPNIFSLEMWGGATFDVALRFLHECPWERLRLIREAVPNILLQMLFRGSNGVGYKAYPDNLIEEFIEKSWDTGIDIFRIFDSMNWLEAMKVSIKAVKERTNGIAEVSICYTGDILDPKKTKFDLQYYLDLAREIEDEGAHILAIKDMAGLLKPKAAELLITELKKSISIPIHLHTHDTSSVQASAYLRAIESGVDIVDVAMASMSGLTSQPNFNSIIAMLSGHERAANVDLDSLNEFSNYWEEVREYYYPFECGLKAGTAQVYDHEIPGGQYSNLRPQARALGLEEQFEKVKENYTLVNKMLGDIVKVTPSSKVVGDFALFMTSNNLSEEDIYEKGDELSFPESLKNFFRGDLGQPYQGFPEKLQKIVLKNEKPYTCRPNEMLEPLDLDKEFEKFQSKYSINTSFLDFLSSQLYPKVYDEYYKFNEFYGSVESIPTPEFFYGLKENEEVLVEIGPGKNIIVNLVYVSEPDERGSRTVFFKLNGQSRAIEVKDKSVKSSRAINKKAESSNEIGSPLQGKVSKVLVKEGDKVKKDDSLFVIEAMKMETTVASPISGKVKKIHLNDGEMVESNDLVVELQA